MATYQSPSFLKKMMRTLEGSLQLIFNDYSEKAKSIKKTNAISSSKPISLSTRATISHASSPINSALNNLVSFFFLFFFSFVVFFFLSN